MGAHEKCVGDSTSSHLREEVDEVEPVAHSGEAQLAQVVLSEVGVGVGLGLGLGLG